MTWRFQAGPRLVQGGRRVSRAGREVPGWAQARSREEAGSKGMSGTFTSVLLVGLVRRIKYIAFFKEKVKYGFLSQWNSLHN